MRAKQKSGEPSGSPDPDERPTIDKPPRGELWDDQNDRQDEDQTVEKRVIGGAKPPAEDDVNAFALYKGSGRRDARRDPQRDFRSALGIFRTLRTLQPSA
jgi:hypothetical protein